jgi:CHASE2 domain-containing sensor protein
VFRADWTFLDFTLYLWAVAAVFGIIYLCIHRRPRDPILHVALCLGATLTVAALICFLLWLVVGGWGPPAPELFGGLAILLGLFFAKATYAQERA